LTDIPEVIRTAKSPATKKNEQIFHEDYSLPVVDRTKDLFDYASVTIRTSHKLRVGKVPGSTRLPELSK